MEDKWGVLFVLGLIRYDIILLVSKKEGKRKLYLGFSELVLICSNKSISLLRYL